MDNNFIVPKGSTCNDCEHNGICAIKEDFKKLCSEAVERLELMENKKFHLSAHCKYYKGIVSNPKNIY